MRSPLFWFGGKGNMIPRLLPLIPPHRVSVETFGGGASLLFAKKPSLVEIYNDMDGNLVNFFRVIRDEEQFPRFWRKAFFTPYCREEFYWCRENLEDGDPVERAWRFFVVVRQAFGGDFRGEGTSWGYSVNSSRRGMTATCSKFTSCVDVLPEVHARLRRVQVEQGDFREIIPRYDTPETFFYLDPPYVPETRTHGGYTCEMTAEDHAALVDLLLGLKGMAILSGYPNGIYAPLEAAGWERREWKTACSAAGRTRGSGIQGEGAATRMQPRTECAWISPSAQKQGNLFERQAERERLPLREER